MFPGQLQIVAMLHADSVGSAERGPQQGKQEPPGGLTFSNSKLVDGVAPALELSSQTIDEAVSKLCLGGCLISLGYG